MVSSKQIFRNYLISHQLNMVW